MSDQVGMHRLMASDPDDAKAAWSAFVRSAGKSVTVSAAMVERLRKSLETGEMIGFRFAVGPDDEIGVALSMIREDVILGRRELIIYAAASLRKINNTEWAGCFERINEYAAAVGCDHISYYTTVPRLFEVGRILGGSETHYISIPVRR